MTWYGAAVSGNTSTETELKDLSNAMKRCFADAFVLKSNPYISMAYLLCVWWEFDYMQTLTPLVIGENSLRLAQTLTLETNNYRFCLYYPCGGFGRPKIHNTAKSLLNVDSLLLTGVSLRPWRLCCLQYDSKIWLMTAEESIKSKCQIRWRLTGRSIFGEHYFSRRCIGFTEAAPCSSNGAIVPNWWCVVSRRYESLPAQCKLSQSIDLLDKEVHILRRKCMSQWGCMRAGSSWSQTLQTVVQSIAIK